VHTRCRIFSSKSTRKCLVAVLHPDPLGELQHSPRHENGIRGREGKEMGGERKVSKSEEKGWKERGKNEYGKGKEWRGKGKGERSS